MSVDQEFEEICTTCQTLAASLVAVCDGAVSQDGTGFSKSDVRMGRVMAYTPAQDWSLELLEAGLACLKTYSRTQLSRHRDQIAGWARAVTTWRNEQRQVGKSGYVRPILGVEKNAAGEDVLCLHTLGFGDPAADKALTHDLRALRAKFDPRLGTYTFPRYTSITTDYAAALRDLLDRIILRPKAQATLKPLLAIPTATTHFLRVHPTQPSQLLVFLPRRKEIWAEYCAATPFSRVRNGITGYGTLAPHINDRATLTAFIDKHHLHLYPGVPEVLAKAFTQAQAASPIPAHRLYMDNGLIAVTTPAYNPDFVAWMKLVCKGARFTKDNGPARWLVQPAASAKLEALRVGLLTLNVPSYHIPPDVGAHIQAAGMAKQMEETQRLALAAINAQDTMDYQVRPGLKGTLFPHQPTCVAYAEAAMSPNKGILIADEMGLGKTIECLAILHHKQCYPAIVLCPSGMTRKWEEEARTWLPDNVRIQRANTSAEAAAMPRADVTILSCGLLADNVDHLKRLQAQTVILDEAHAYQSHKSQRGIAAEQLMANTPWRILTSGTPIRNRNKNWVHPLRLIGRLDQFGGSTAFLARYCGAHQDERGHWNYDADTNTAELRDLLRETCMIRREKATVAPYLPPKIHSTLKIPLSNPADYHAARTRLIEYLAENPRAERAIALRMITELRVTTGRGKISAALDFTEDWEKQCDAKLIVYARHQEVLDAWRATRPNTLFIDGTTSAAQRSRHVTAFQNDPAQRLIVISDAGSMGITLTAATAVLVVERSFTPADIDQAIDRAHRIGQTKPVNVYHLVAPGTIDDNLLEIEKDKRSNIDILMSGATPTEKAQASGADLLLSSFKAEAEALKKTIPVPEDDALTPAGLTP